MKTKYNIKSEFDGEIRVVYSDTTKRRIESFFNKLMKEYRKDNRCIVENIRIGYCRVTNFYTFGSFVSEYRIERA